MRIAVVGSGIAGLTLSLLAARAGHDVVVVDRDPRRDGDDVESAWERWDRRSVPQFRQIHGFQAVAHGLLRQRLPDLLESLHQAGAHDVSRLGAISLVDALAAGRVDPVVSVAFARYRNLLDPPAAFWGDEGLVDRVRAAIANGDGRSVPLLVSRPGH